MGWAVGEREGRHIGYGVPAICDYPECGVKLDRGLSYACGGGVTGDFDNCGRFFCDDHMSYPYADDENETELSNYPVCERCEAMLKGDETAVAFDPTPDSEEWAEWVLTDESWAQWRRENPRQVEAYYAIVAG